MSELRIVLITVMSLSPVLAKGDPRLITVQCDDVQNVIVIGESVVYEHPTVRGIVFGAIFDIESNGGLEIRCYGDTATIEGNGLVTITGEVKIERQ